MLPSRINPDKCLVKTPYVGEMFRNVKIKKNVSKLKSRLIALCQTPGQRNSVNNYFTHHTGRSGFLWRLSSSQQQKMVKKYLSYILAALEGKVPGIEITEDRKIAIVAKLTEGIEHCQEGYLNRLYVVMGSLQQPQSIDELLAAYRVQLVEKAVQAMHIEEVHAHHAVYEYANSFGYAIPYEEVNDRYSGGVSRDQAQRELKKVFNIWYQPKEIVRHLWEQADLELLGYAGKKEVTEGYTLSEYEGILNYFRNVFADESLTLQDVFLIDEDIYAITDINLKNIQSRLIQYLEENSYFKPFANQSRYEFKHRRTTLYYTFDANHLDGGLLVCERKSQPAQYQYGVGGEDCILKQLPEKTQKLFDDWLSSKAIESTTPALLLLAVQDNDIYRVKKILDVLVSKGGRIWTKNESGDTALHLAINTNNEKLVSLLVEYGADVSAKNNAGKTTIEVAAAKRYWGCVRTLVSVKSDGLDQESYANVLRVAVSVSQVDVVKDLVQANVDLNVADGANQNGSLLHIAVRNRNADIIKLLLEHGADITVKNRSGKTAIEVASENRWWDGVAALASVKTDEKDNANYGMALVAAARDMHFMACCALLEAGASLTQVENYYGNSALHYAVQNNEIAMVSALIWSGRADLTVKNKQGKTPIVLAAEQRHWYCVEGIASKKSDEEDKADYAGVLLLAVQANELNCVNSLLDSPGILAKVEQQSAEGVLHAAVSNHSVEMVSLLLRHGADITKKNRYGKTPIQMAAENGRWDFVRAFTKRETDREDNAKYGIALICAVRANQYSLVGDLLRANASTNEEYNGVGLLHNAVGPRRREMIALLLAHGADASKKNGAGKTAIQSAVDNGYWDAVAGFATVQCDKDDNAGYGYALTKAVSNRRFSEALMLLNAGANRQIVDGRNNDSLLHLAVNNNDPGMIMLLIRHGVDANLKNNQNKTPLEVARQYNRNACIQALETFKPKPEPKPQVVSVIHPGCLWLQPKPSNDKVVKLSPDHEPIAEKVGYGYFH